jgi:HSP20 family protein
MILSKDLMEMTGPNFATGNQFAICQFKRDRQKIEIELAAPGLKKEDFKIELDNKMLTISSEKNKKKRRKGITRIIIASFNHSPDL